MAQVLSNHWFSCHTEPSNGGYICKPKVFLCPALLPLVIFVTVLFSIPPSVAGLLLAHVVLQDHWNRFDFLVVAVSLFVLPFDGPGTSGFRMLRILRMFRLIKRYRGLKVVFTTLFLALPSLVNIFVLVLLVMFIFGVAGVRWFGKIPVDTTPGLTHNANFSNLYYALILLYTISTTDTWGDVMEGCAYGAEGTWIAIPYFIIYMLLVNCFLRYAFIAVILTQFDTSFDPGEVCLAIALPDRQPSALQSPALITPSLSVFVAGRSL